MKSWELLIVDNASAETLTSRFDIAWHPNGSFLLEPKLGLTPARLRGIAAASSDLLVFVDDDNVLATDFLATAVEISIERPWLGCWGGRVTGEFEIDPPTWLRPHLGYLALREVARDCWGNSTSSLEATPNGAGLCVRTHIARIWANKTAGDKMRISLGRTGVILSSAEDTDLAWTACDLGFGTGLIARLQLTHLIPKERLTLEYFERLLEGVSCSHILLENIRTPILQRPKLSLAHHLFWHYQIWRMSKPERRLQKAIARGRQLAYDRLGI